MNAQLQEDLGEGVLLELVQIPAGKYLMGAPKNEPLSTDAERPQHLVVLSEFWIGQFPVTQVQWRIVAGYPQCDRVLAPHPSNFDFRGDRRPVEQVSWEEATEFCQRLSVKSNQTYRLPSESEWEYACRAGSTTPFHHGNVLTTDLANYNSDYVYNGSEGGRHRTYETSEVGSYQANDWGLHDVHGNVWEWCIDDWHPDYEGGPGDGSAWINRNNSTEKLLRGGAWNAKPEDCRSASRIFYPRDYRDNDFGFRVVREATT